MEVSELISTCANSGESKIQGRSIQGHELEELNSIEMRLNGLYYLVCPVLIVELYPILYRL